MLTGWKPNESILAGGRVRAVRTDGDAGQVWSFQCLSVMYRECRGRADGMLLRFDDRVQLFEKELEDY